MIEVVNLTKRFKDFTAVDRISFEVSAGEIFGFLGPNGAGKTTTIMMLTTLLRLSDGRVTVCDFDVSKEQRKIRRKIGVVFQDHTSDDWLTGREYLQLHAGIYDVSEDRVEDLLKLFDLKRWEKSVIKEYSSGMRRRLEIARGLIHNPGVLFLDEPTLGLDVQTRQRIWDHIESLRNEDGITVFLTTHYMDEADKLCDRIAIIDHGRIVAIGTPDELKSVMDGTHTTLDEVFLHYTGRDTRDRVSASRAHHPMKFGRWRR
ncbi:MAG: ATP-binding cassette domain-containing protein [Gammaproteobacteria bacterium]|nr:ATP-binding cassette domain-containing protein [Gammaproteobacteria bacterium]